MVAPTITNPDFETAGTDPGEADGWTITAATVTPFEVAGFDGDTLGYEGFDSGWGLLLLEFTDADLEAANFVGAPVDNFERGWGPFDGTDSNYATKVLALANLGDNTGFIFEFSLLAAAQFDSAIVGENFEDFEEGWPDNEDFVFAFVGVGADLTAASFDVGAPESVEDFEEEWQSNESFVFDFVGIGTDLEAASFDAAVPQDFEDFEEVVDGDELFEVVTGVVGDWLIEINGTPFVYPSVGAGTTTIRNGLRDAINNGNLQVLASNGPGTDQVLIKNLSTQFTPLVVKGQAPAGGVLTRVTAAERADSWLQPLLGF